MTALNNWTKATTNLPWGVQTVFKDTLQAVADEQVTMVYGADYKSGSPCLVNATAHLLEKLNGNGGSGKPSHYFNEVVSSFDAANRLIAANYSKSIEGIVSPFAADILIHNFGKMKDKPIASSVHDAVKNEAFAEHIYHEPTDEDLTREWVNALSKPCTSEDDSILAAYDFDPSKVFADDEPV